MKVPMFVRSVMQEADHQGSTVSEHVTLQVAPELDRKEGEPVISGTLSIVSYRNFGVISAGEKFEITLP